MGLEAIVFMKMRIIIVFCFAGQLAVVSAWYVPFGFDVSMARIPVHPICFRTRLWLDMEGGDVACVT